ncbi:MAG: hypothetical protein ACYTKD_09505 [Planctomycetota bacterium]|jgi:hypothetical protein
MGEGGEKKKASSLRGRVARSRKTYSRKSNPMPLVIGAAVLAVMGVGMYFVLGNSTPKRPRQPEVSTTTQPDAGAPAVSSQPARQVDTLFKLLHWAREDSLKDPDKALSDLRAQESKYGSIPDFQIGLAMAVDKKIGRAQGNAAKKGLAEEKLRYLEKTQELLDAGKSWDSDPMGTKSSNLKTSLEQCKLLIDKYSN